MSSVIENFTNKRRNVIYRVVLKKSTLIYRVGIN